MPDQLQSHARVIIAGGGIIGCSVAYHLTLRGWKDVVLLDKGELTSGSTWHAAGLVGQLRSSRNVTQMLKYSSELYARLEEETGQPTGFQQVGGLRLACTPERVQELKRSVTMAATFGMTMDMLRAEEALRIFPGMAPDGILAAAFLPTDGYIDPAGVTMALAKGARERGAMLHRNTRVESMSLGPAGGFVVQTSAGEIACDVFVNCAGMWAPQLGSMLGVLIPIQAMQHQYLATRPISAQAKGVPTLRDPDNLLYYKEEGGALVMGAYEQNPIPWAVAGVPEDFGQTLLPPDFDHFEPAMRQAVMRTPVLEDAEIVKLINGPEGFTPDGNPIMGAAPELHNYFVAAGFNAFGIASGGGAGRAMAEWIIDGRPSLDLWELDILRFGGPYHDPDYVRMRTVEGYARHYAISWPFEESAVCRPLRTSPLYDILKQRGAVFGEKFGWERPNWFARDGVAAEDELTFGRPNWFAQVGREHEAVRERAGIIDQTSFSKFELTGAGVLDFLQSITGNEMHKPTGTITYTQMLTEAGGIACDLTVTRLPGDLFYITTGTAFGPHDGHWMRSHMPADGSVQLREVTMERACINICGPAARAILEPLSGDDLSNQGFPYLTAREILLGDTSVRALRVTYVGEAGWELHVPVENALRLYELIWQAGQSHGLANVGYRAIESLRLEKGYRYWSKDITPDYTPYEAGLGFCVKLDKGQFLGRDALLGHKKEGPRRRLRTITVEDERAWGTGKEAILDNGSVIASATSSGYGYTVGKSIFLAYLPIANCKQGTALSVEILGERFAGRVEQTVLYDPKNERVRQ